ncbi:Glycoside hydrolase, putative cellulase [Carpediemonas membranifera]|uniref:Glycoside hydrolase, putative cellulase n=1 Tax=Carpediemonas membranifera TaxID=201153 RepID=A0A8J6E757_9EUKA|nr:Glycoside hydrolase, putative cellulase [Carpediemonas membranifera]|eukprot:KAG9390325.1 Glycoside hydrolase, putative cellulase [Carpediemonas membranifera]
MRTHFKRWTKYQAWKWAANHPWHAGCNYTPRYAINQIEMWHEATFNRLVIAEELDWLVKCGLTGVRVYLHDLLWKNDAETFFANIRAFLDLCGARGISVVFTVFDDCWYDRATYGIQPAPVPGLHNSGWVQSPGDRVLADPDHWSYLEAYVRDLMRTFGDDPRILMWDLYNECENFYLPSLSQPNPTSLFTKAKVLARKFTGGYNSELLLIKAFEWARTENPSQPLTSSVYLPIQRLKATVLQLSDVITFHNYSGAKSLVKDIKKFKQLGRPVVCTEWLARPSKSLVQTHLPIFKEHAVSCYNWGFVDGKTQTKFTWKDRQSGDEPKVWFHDLLKSDGTPYDAEEIRVFQELTGGKSKS